VKAIVSAGIAESSQVKRLLHYGAEIRVLNRGMLPLLIIADTRRVGTEKGISEDSERIRRHITDFERDWKRATPLNQYLARRPRQ
jgi:hypothetical protein